MPNYYAHLKFGSKVLSELPSGLAGAIERERTAFDLGCLGPDPLFFYQPIRPNAVRREGVWMHRRSALPAVKRLRQAIEEGVPMSTGYGAGFFCHLALDSACHGYVDERTEEGPISHMAIEGEFDRMLMLDDGLDVTAGVYLPPIPEDRKVWQAAAQAFVHASPEQLRRAYRAMTWLTAFLVHSCGNWRGTAIDVVSRMLPIRSSKGISLDPEPHPASLTSSAVLANLMEEAVPEAAKQIDALFQAVQKGDATPLWFDRDFKGNPPHTCGRLARRRPADTCT